MPLRCPQCGASVAADDVNLQSGFAKCRYCNSIFSFVDQLPRSPQSPAPFHKRQVDMPKGFRVDYPGSDMVIVRRWFSAKYLALLPFCLFWDGFLVFWYVMAFAAHGPLIMKVFPVLHVGVGVFLTYMMLAGFVNSTWIAAGPAELSVRHGPLPWPGRLVVPRTDIDQLFSEQKVMNGKNGVSYSYKVSLLKPGGERLSLVQDLETPEQALFIEEKVESFLGLQDRPVVGEMGPE